MTLIIDRKTGFVTSSKEEAVAEKAAAHGGSK